MMLEVSADYQLMIKQSNSLQKSKDIIYVQYRWHLVHEQTVMHCWLVHESVWFAGCPSKSDGKIVCW
jgi:hypothetical protein